MVIAVAALDTHGCSRLLCLGRAAPPAARCQHLPFYITEDKRYDHSTCSAKSDPGLPFRRVGEKPETVVSQQRGPGHHSWGREPNPALHPGSPREGLVLLQKSLPPTESKASNRALQDKEGVSWAGAGAGVAAAGRAG